MPANGRNHSGNSMPLQRERNKYREVCLHVSLRRIHVDMASGMRFRGRAIGKSLAGFASAFPDFHREDAIIYVAENVVVRQLATRGTHKGELSLPSGTLAPTGKGNRRPIVRRLSPR